MSWIQSFFQAFKKDDEEYEEDIHKKNDIESNKKSATSQSKDNSRKAEARIAYHYPKGQFRFPLIPDGKELSNQPRHRNRHKKRNEPSPIVTEPVKKEKPIVKEVKPPIPKKTVKNVRPFKPTEIPSPIYGFERPKKVDLIEHELTDFAFKPNDTLQESPILEAADAFNSAPAPDEVVIQEETVLKQEEKIIGRTGLEEAAVFLETLFEEEKKIPNTNFEETFELIPVSAATEIIEEKTEEFRESSIGEVAKITLETEFQEETEIIFETVIETETETEISHKTLYEEVALVSQELPMPQAKGTETLAESYSLEGKLQVIHETQVDVVEEIESIEVSNQTTVLLESAVTNVEAISFEKSEGLREPLAGKGVSNDEHEDGNLTKVRRHLPFNVLMLKQDKRKLEEKLKTLGETKKQDLSTMISSEKEPVITEFESAQEIVKVMDLTAATLESEPEPEYYIFPDTLLLNPPVFEEANSDWLSVQETQLNVTLQNFNVGAKVVNVTQGPAVTRFEVQPEPGVKVNKITNLSDDIKLSLAARDIRIEAPIPGKHTIGIEVPNQVSRPVTISEIINTSIFTDQSSPLTAVLGLDISGAPIVTDLKKMPHGLIAGATGSGKSVCINSILVSLLYKASPEELKLLLIDPKMVELAPYNRIPHLVSPVITDVKAATAALKWAVEEMERRYELFAHTGVRDINRFNELAVSHQRYSDKLPFIVIIIDELADLMMMSPADVEEAICRIAQKARACGIHLIVATQRPSVDVITGLIKANIPTRVAFSVSSQIDSRTIIDISGAEKLLGRGDMLFLENGSSKPVRLQGTFVSDEEIDRVVAHVRRERDPEYLFEQDELLKKAQVTEEEDELFYEACEFVVDQGGASTSSLQRRFKIGYNRAARLMDMMEKNGFISGAKGSRPRDVLITEAELESFQDS